MSAAARLALLAVLQRTTAREVALRCRVTRSCVSSWGSGKSVPSPRAQVALSDIYGIDPRGWLPKSPYRAKFGTATACASLRSPLVP